MTPNSSSNMQKHGCLCCVHTVPTKENISGFWILSYLNSSITCASEFVNCSDIDFDRSKSHCKYPDWDTQDDLKKRIGIYIFSTEICMWNLLKFVVDPSGSPGYFIPNTALFKSNPFYNILLLECIYFFFLLLLYIQYVFISVFTLNCHSLA